MLPRVADVKYLAGRQGLRDEDAHFEFEVEGLCWGVGWRGTGGWLDYTAGAMDRGVCDFQAGGAAVIDRGNREEAWGYGGVHYFGALWWTG